MVSCPSGLLEVVDLSDQLVRAVRRDGHRLLVRVDDEANVLLDQRWGDVLAALRLEAQVAQQEVDRGVLLVRPLLRDADGVEDVEVVEVGTRTLEAVPALMTL